MVAPPSRMEQAVVAPHQRDRATCRDALYASRGPCAMGATAAGLNNPSLQHSIPVPLGLPEDHHLPLASRLSSASMEPGKPVQPSGRSLWADRLPRRALHARRRRRSRAHIAHRALMSSAPEFSHRRRLSPPSRGHPVRWGCLTAVTASYASSPRKIRRIRRLLREMGNAARPRPDDL